jgi:hypothetical protein
MSMNPHECRNLRKPPRLRALSAAARHAATSRLTLAAVLTALVLLASAAPTRAAGKNLCNLVTQAAVGQALHTNIVRAEAPDTDAGCTWSAKGTATAAVTDHGMAMIGGMGANLDPQSRKMIASFGGAMVGDAGAKQDKEAAHPGELPVLVFSVMHSADAVTEMKNNRDALGRLGGQLTVIPNLGDEAFESAGSTLMVRKGGNVIRFFYTQCNCTSKDVVPLARQIVAGL